VAPTPPRRRAYQGLHAAAHRGDLAALIAAAGRRQADAERARRPWPHAAARGHLRAPARGGPRAAAAGADLGAAGNDRYDAVTIAAVADDEETLRVLLALGASASWSPAATTAPR
jgi:hypothetical protein